MGGMCQSERSEGDASLIFFSHSDCLLFFLILKLIFFICYPNITVIAEDESPEYCEAQGSYPGEQYFVLCI